MAAAAAAAGAGTEAGAYDYSGGVKRNQQKYAKFFFGVLVLVTLKTVTVIGFD